MDYGDIIICIENIVESIEFEELDLIEIKSKLQDLIYNIEDNTDIDNEGLEGFNFD
jgi:TATA-box binding protein (TBP) (component of TFIID and TFIIIB)